jgi:hypothetical protein
MVLYFNLVWKKLIKIQDKLLKIVFIKKIILPANVNQLHQEIKINKNYNFLLKIYLKIIVILNIKKMLMVLKIKLIL